MNEIFDVAIIGGGAIGAATLHFLAKSGLSNSIMIEKQSEFARGSTVAWGALLRQFGALPFYIENSSQALRYYLEKFSHDTGFDLNFSKTGAIYFLDKKQASLVQKSKALIESKNGFPIEIITALEGQRRFPEFQWFDDDLAVYESVAGTLDADQVVGGWISSARQNGAQAHVNMKIIEFLTKDNLITGFRCEDGKIYFCKQLILCAGAWTPSLLDLLALKIPMVNCPIQVNRLQYETENPERGIPLFIDGTSDTFGRPLPDGGFLGGHLLDERSTQPEFRQPLSLGGAAEAKRRLSKRLKYLRTSSLVGGLRTLESYSTTDKPIMEYSEKYKNLFIAAGWSCTGFALAPSFGQYISQHVIKNAEIKK